MNLLRGGLLAQDYLRRIAWRQLQDQEHEQGYADQYRDQHNQSLNNEFPHKILLFSCLCRLMLKRLRLNWAPFPASRPPFAAAGPKAGNRAALFPGRLAREQRGVKELFLSVNCAYSAQ